jgi:2',3'-cyclic-nucleotide 2'-phosphodiesterase (5'-nucleotidase family)
VLKPLLQKYDHHLVLDAGGWAERKAEKRELATQLLLQGLQEQGLQIANVSARDLLLGPEALAHLRAEFGVQLVSANVRVDGAPLALPYVILQQELDGRPLRIGVTGVTSTSQSVQEAWPDSSRLEIGDPLEAAAKMLETLRPQTDLCILLASLPLHGLDEMATHGGYDLYITSSGELRPNTPVGPVPAVLGPGTSGKHLAWMYLQRGAGGRLEISGGQVLPLDDKIKDDPEVATQVQEFKTRLRGQPGPEERAQTSAPPAPPVPEPAASHP